MVAHMLGGHRHGRAWSDDVSSSSWFWRIDARAKLVAVLSFVIASSLMTQPKLVLASLVSAVVFAGASRISPRTITKAYLVALPFILMAAVSVFLFAGLRAGLVMSARTSACVLPLLVLANGTEPFDLFAGLRRLRMPAIITTLLMLTHKFILILSDELGRMSIARKARGFAGGKNLLDKYSLRVLAFTAGMVLVRSSGRGDRVYEALKSRGFNREMTEWRTSKVGVIDTTFACTLLILAFGLLLAELGVVA